MAITTLRWLMVVAALALVWGRRLLAERNVLALYWRSLFLRGAFGYTAFNALFYVAAHHTSAISIGLIQGAIPALVLLGSVILYRTRVGALQSAGFALAFAGVLVATCRGDPAALAGLSFNVGDVLMLVASVLYAGYVLALRKRIPASPEAVFAGMALAALVTSLPLLGFEVATGTVQWPTAKGWALVAFIGLIPSLVSQLFFMRGVELIGPARAGLFVNLIPVAAAFLGVVLLGETFAPFHTVALAMVLGGVGLAEAGKQDA